MILTTPLWHQWLGWVVLRLGVEKATLTMSEQAALPPTRCLQMLSAVLVTRLHYYSYSYVHAMVVVQVPASVL